MANEEAVMTFDQWLEKLAEVTRTWMANTPVTTMDEAARHDYYEGQPETWREYYDDGMTPEDAMQSDQGYWEE